MNIGCLSSLSAAFAASSALYPTTVIVSLSGMYALVQSNKLDCNIAVLNLISLLVLYFVSVSSFAWNQFVGLNLDGLLSIFSMRVCLSAESAKNVSWPWLSPLQRWGSLTMAFTGKFVYTAHHSILLRLNPFDLRVDKEGWWFEHSIS